MIIKGLIFCDQILQAVIILDEIATSISKSFVCNIFYFFLLFSEIFSVLMFHLAVASQQYQIYFFKYLKSLQKASAMNEKSHFSYFAGLQAVISLVLRNVKFTGKYGTFEKYFRYYTGHHAKMSTCLCNKELFVGFF